MTPAAMRVTVLAVDKKFKRLERPVAFFIRAALRLLRLKRVSVEAYLVGGRRAPHTVLSFPWERALPRPDVRGRHLGEIYLNPVLVRREGASLPELVIHGILHLAGYDHKWKRDRVKMERKEKELVRKIGWRESGQ